MGPSAVDRSWCSEPGAAPSTQHWGTPIPPQPPAPCARVDTAPRSWVEWNGVGWDRLGWDLPSCSTAQALLPKETEAS